MNYGFKGRTKPSKEFPRGLSKGLRALPLDGKVVGDVPVEAGEADPTKEKEKTAQFRCSVSGCKRTFKAKHLAASHFRGKHKELNVEKESWRSYVDPV